MIWFVAIAVYIVVNIILLFMLMYDDVQNGGSGVPDHPFLSIPVFVLLGIPLLIVYAIVGFVRRNLKR